MDLIKSGIEGNDVEFEVKKRNPVANGYNSDSKSVLISVFKYIEFLLK